MRKLMAIYFLLVLGFIPINELFATDVTEEWAVRYNGPANSHDYAQSMACDNSGNIYVTGYSYGAGTAYDYATVKYDTHGNQLWVARYNGLANSHDYARGIAVDSSGNVYVTGESYGTGYDYATVKYDTHGNQLWVNRYNGPANSHDYARGIAVDSSGNVYVTGESYGTGYDYATVKYDTNGNQLWAVRYNGLANSHDYARGIAVDSSGNVYVTGESYGTNYDYATIKYDTNGNQLWVNRYNDSQANYHDYARGIAVDSSGNVYVTGYNFVVWGGFSDYVTVKYDTNGNQLWVSRYNRAINSYDYARGIAVDSSGNVYVTGANVIGFFFYYATVKYDTNGNQLWVNRYNDSPIDSRDVARGGIAVDSSGNVYVTGTSYGAGYDYATIKYDTSGNQMWVARYNGPANSGDYARGIAVDSSGNVYVTGYSYGTNYDYATVKYATQIISATVDVNPDTINLKSKGNYITGYIELPPEYSVNNIDITTVAIKTGTASVSMETTPATVGDYDADGIPDLMVKFSRSAVHQLLSVGDIQLTISGSLTTGLSFEGADTVRVIDMGKEHTSETSHQSVQN